MRHTNVIQRIASLSSCAVVAISFPERAKELEIRIESLETELRENETEANEVISQWQSSCAEAESKCSNMEEELDHLKARIESLHTSSAAKDEDKTKYTEMTRMLAQKENELEQLKEESRSSKLSLQELKGMWFMVVYDCLLSVIQVSSRKCTHLLLTLLLVHRRSIGTESRHCIIE